MNFGSFGEDKFGLNEDNQSPYQKKYDSDVQTDDVMGAIAKASAFQQQDPFGGIAGADLSNQHQARGQIQQAQTAADAQAQQGKSNMFGSLVGMGMKAFGL